MLQSKAIELSYSDIWTTMSLGFDPAAGRVTFTGNVLATSDIVIREPDVSLLSLEGLVSNFLHFRVKVQLSSLLILDSTFERKSSLYVGKESCLVNYSVVLQSSLVYFVNKSL
jgi:hypothetical protein